MAAGEDAAKPVNRLISRSDAELRLFQRVDDALVEVSAPDAARATPADAVAALARLCAPDGDDHSAAHSADHLRTTVIEADGATPPPADAAGAGTGDLPRDRSVPDGRELSAGAGSAGPSTHREPANGATELRHAEAAGDGMGAGEACGPAAGADTEAAVRECAAGECAAGCRGVALGGPGAEPPVRLRCRVQGNGSVACDVHVTAVGSPPAMCGEGATGPRSLALAGRDTACHGGVQVEDSATAGIHEVATPEVGGTVGAAVPSPAAAPAAADASAPAGTAAADPAARRGDAWQHSDGGGVAGVTEEACERAAPAAAADPCTQREADVPADRASDGAAPMDTDPPNGIAATGGSAARGSSPPAAAAAADDGGVAGTSAAAQVLQRLDQPEVRRVVNP